MKSLQPIPKLKKGIPFDYVITVCDRTHESSPLFTGPAKVIHVGFDDPPKAEVDLEPWRGQL